MSFLEVRFPDTLSYGSSGGPQYNTTVSTSRGGAESRNANWAAARKKFNAAYNVQSLDDLDLLLDWFHVCRGRSVGFRFKDWSDYKSCNLVANPSAVDQAIGSGTGVQLTFQLKKTYQVGSSVQAINIYKPVSGTVLVAVNGVVKTVTTDYTINYATGIITFVVAPGAGTAITAGFQYDVPVRFDTDDLSGINAVNFNVFSSDVPLIETRDIA